ncbi:MAG: hypothetical protein IJV08_09955 [Bacteroidaceae bacterium]|nr:hypothetical protein [Bacteroidaceae bacterium]
MKIHIICSETPNLTTSSYAMEVYYQLEALHTLGYETEIHVLEKNGESALLAELDKDDAPLLFEGIQCCHLLPNPNLRKHFKAVRLQYIRHIVLEEKARHEGWTLHGLRLRWKARQAKQKELHELTYADAICAITKGDYQRLYDMLPNQTLVNLPCFFNEHIPAHHATQPFLLCQGYLGEDEEELDGIRKWILNDIAPLCPGVLFVMVSRNAPTTPVPSNVKIIQEPSQEYLDQLIETARIHLILSQTTTGIKMEVLIALTKGCGNIIGNHETLYGHSLGRFCTRADQTSEIAEAINNLINNDIKESEMLRRQQYLQKMKKAGISRLSLFK